MTIQYTATETLDRGFLEIRHQLIDIAAGLDRIDLGSDRERLADDPRMQQLIAGVNMLLDGRGGRAERIQMIFSDSYDANWRNP